MNSRMESYIIAEEPFYLPINDEVEIFSAAFQTRTPVLLKGPTGTGKTRFVEYMAHRLGKAQAENEPDRFLPLVTIACHEDLTATDLVGKYLLISDETVWVDGPLTRVVKSGGICYLDEIVEARKDTTVIIHSLTDHRRILPIDKTGQIITAHPRFFLVISYNPGYQSIIKDLKPSTRQRFVSIEFSFPDRKKEALIIAREAGVDPQLADGLALLGEKVRNMKGYALKEGAGTRLLVYAARLIQQGIGRRRACEIAVMNALSDDAEVQRAISEVISTIFT